MDGAAWSVRVYYKPFIRWIWLGGLLMMAGGLCSVSDRRYRITALTQQSQTLRTAVADQR
jgi:cytochrome c-type biogenesis protein CcmF